MRELTFICPRRKNRGPYTTSFLRFRFPEKTVSSYYYCYYCYPYFITGEVVPAILLQVNILNLEQREIHGQSRGLKCPSPTSRIQPKLERQNTRRTHVNMFDPMHEVKPQVFCPSVTVVKNDCVTTLTDTCSDSQRGLVIISPYRDHGSCSGLRPRVADTSFYPSYPSIVE